LISLTNDIALNGLKQGLFKARAKQLRLPGIIAASWKRSRPAPVVYRALDLTNDHNLLL
jgi:hypothetical protein